MPDKTNWDKCLEYIARNSLTTVDFAEGVTRIGEYAFYPGGSTPTSALTNVTLPSTLTSIGASAFKNVKTLTELFFPADAPTIGSNAFAGTNLTAYYYSGANGWTDSLMASHSSVTWISMDSLLMLNADEIALFLTGSDFGGMQMVGVRLFGSAKGDSVAWVSSDENVVRVENGLLTATGEGSATITALSSSGFSDECLVTVTGVKVMRMPEKLTALASEAFSGSGMLEAVYLPDGMSSIADRAFSDCTGLKIIRIPGTVTSIDESAFDGCTQLIICCPDNSVAADFAGRKGIPTLPLR